MPWSSGTYTKWNASNVPPNWVGDASVGIKIEASRHDTQDDDFAAGINNCLTKDGSNAATGNINLGSNRIINVSNAVAANDALTLGQAQAGISASGTALSITNTRFSNDAGGSSLSFAKSRGAAVGVNTIVQSGDQIGVIAFNGANGTGYNNAAAIIASVDGTPGATNDMPGALRFYTTPDGSGLLAERVIIRQDGKTGIGTSSPLTQLTVAGAGENAAPADAGNKSASIRVTSTGGGANDGGQVEFGFGSGSYAQSYFAAIKGLGVNGSGNTQGDLAFYVRSSTGSTSLTEHMRISNNGRIGFGVNPSIGKIDVAALSNGITASLRGRPADNIGILMMTEDGGTEVARIEHDTTYLQIQKSGANPIIFTSAATERARFAGTDGHFCVGTTNDAPANNNVTGAVVRTDGLIEASRSGTGGGGTGIRVNRRTDDGTLIEFLRGATSVGSISVSSGSVSYNSFSGSHWSQLEDGSRPEILIGTVLESIGDMCQWPNENENILPKVKVSDTAGTSAVYGVFRTWDNDWELTNDMLVVSVGAFMVRVSGDETVSVGDLLESNGDGTARVQADNIIKSSTIGKVVSTNKSIQHPDGSYCVPTVLYCG